MADTISLTPQEKFKPHLPLYNGQPISGKVKINCYSILKCFYLTLLYFSATPLTLLYFASHQEFHEFPELRVSQ